MAITALSRYTDEYDPNIIADTEGGLPEGWVQLVVTWNGSTLVFSGMENATAWYDANVPDPEVLGAGVPAFAEEGVDPAEVAPVEE